jgi:hypothetical protein
MGAPHGYADVHGAFQDAWWVVAAAAGLGAVTALGMTPRRQV